MKREFGVCREKQGKKGSRVFEFGTREEKRIEEREVG